MIRIYGTMGPSCEKQEVLERMLREGMTGIRVNLSHTTLEQSKERVESYRRACEAQGVPMELMIDLRGPEMRTGWLKEPLDLKEGDLVVMKTRKSKEEYPVLCVAPVFMEALEVGDRVLVRDGEVELEVIEELPQAEPPQPQEAQEEQEEEEAGEVSLGRLLRFLCRTLRGDHVRSQQSVKIEGKEVYGDVLTQSDLENLDLARELGVNAVMQPFVRDGSDVEVVRAALEGRGISARIFAKIESEKGLANLDQIMERADEIVIARGDLGNAMPLWELPRVQVEISRRCLAAGCPFMVVTQMLQSMMRKKTPTRAEVSDIFHAVLDGASSVMVTGETSVGSYPAEVIRYLARTAREAELYLTRH